MRKKGLYTKDMKKAIRYGLVFAWIIVFVEVIISFSSKIIQVYLFDISMSRVEYQQNFSYIFSAMVVFMVLFFTSAYLFIKSKDE